MIFGILIGVYISVHIDWLQFNNLNILNESIGLKSINNREMFFNSLKNNFPIILAMFALGLTLIGVPFILALNILKGFTLGFTFTFFVNSIGFKGILVSILGVLPQNIIYIPCIIIASVLSLSCSINAAKDKYKYNKKINKNLSGYCLNFFIIVAIMILGVIFETYCTPTIIKWIAGVIGCVLG